MASELKTIRGRLLAPDPDERRIVLWPDALIHLDGRGRITDVRRAPEGCDVPETWPGTVVTPGMVDCHLHFPQTRILGSASGPLLPWLERSVFPEESRFVDPEHAQAVADEFCSSMIAQGTTTAGIFSSSHLGATQVLLEALDRRGLRAVTGVTLMDRSAPDAVTLEVEPALAALDELRGRWHGHDDDRLRIAAVPRFAIACSGELMHRAADYAAQHELFVHTHISENLDEIRVTGEMFPDSRDYLGVYEDHGLVGSRTILAHAVHLSEDEWTRLADRDATVAHCPDSNFFLGSGCMSLRKALERGVRVGLGTDVGAGRTFSVRRVAAAAYDASLIVEQPVGPEELLWLATRGGARVLGPADRLGCIAPGFDADLVAIEVPDHVRELSATLDALLFRHDAGSVRATLVRGRPL